MKLVKVHNKNFFRLKKHAVNHRWFIQVGHWVLWLNTDKKTR